MCQGKAGCWKGKVPQTTETTELKPGIRNQELIQEIEPNKMGGSCKDSQPSSFCEPREHGSLLAGTSFNGFLPSSSALAQQHLKSTTKHLPLCFHLALKDCPVGSEIFVETVETLKLPGNCRFSLNEVIILAKTKLISQRVFPLTPNSIPADPKLSRL